MVRHLQKLATRAAFITAVGLVATGCFLDRQATGASDGGLDPCEGIDLLSDPDHCGACERPCPEGEHGEAICVAGVCDVSCPPGRASCDGSAATGCETRLDEPEHCGACGESCSAPTPFCSPREGGGYECSESCALPLVECGGSCVDLDSDVSHCGGCGVSCEMMNATPSCAGGTCEFVCDAGFGDCDGDPDNGCEAALSSLEHCGACDVPCTVPRGTADCGTGTCQVVDCPEGFDNCDGLATTGCETNLGSDRDHCGMCMDACGTGQACVGGECRPETRVVQVSAGGEFSCARLASGAVYCWGQNEVGQLGEGTGVARREVAVQVATIDDAVDLSAGHEHACVVRSGGEVWCWGRNNRRQLGIPADDGDQPSPVGPVAGVTDAVSVSAGREHTCAVIRGGGVRCWGRNNQGQLGTDGGERHESEAVAGVATAIAVGAGGEHTCALLADGHVMCWGRDNHDQLGYGGGDSRSPVEVVDLDAAIGLSVGRDHGCAVRRDGEVRCWGRGGDGRLGYGGSSSQDHARPVVDLIRATRVAAGEAHSCAIAQPDMAVLLGAHCWGAGGDGQLGDDDGNSSETPVAVVAFGVPIDIAAGGKHSCAATEEGPVFCWGKNDRGQLGDDSTDDRDAPVQVQGLP